MTEILNDTPKVCLTIAGLDPSGGAGIIADIRTFSMFGCYAAAVVTSLTFQNTTGVFGATHQTAETVRGQMEPIFADFNVAAAKTGMLPTREVIDETARLLRNRKLANLVVDPVVRSTSGYDLIDDDALTSLVELLFPLAAVVTPNIPEAERIARMTINDEDDIATAGRRLLSMGARAVLIKGGHFKTADTLSRDFLFVGDTIETFEAERIATDSAHGSGCTLAAAITANLALGNDLALSIATAKRFVTEAIRTAPRLGKGHPPVNHLAKIK